MSDIKLVVFFSYGISIKEWVETGLFSREVEVYRRLSSLGVQTTFITYGDETDIECLRCCPDLRVLPLYSRIKSSRSRWMRLLHSFLIPLLFRKDLRGTSVVKANQVWGAWAAVAAKLILRKKLIVRGGYEPYTFLRESGDSLSRRVRMYSICWVVYHAADIIEMATERDMNTLRARFRLSKTKIRVRPNVIDTTAFRPIDGVKAQNSHVLMVGRLNPQKNYRLAIEALSGTNLSVTIIGDGDCRSQIETDAKDLQVAVRFLGQVSNHDLPKIYNEHSIYVLSSLFEGNPKTLLEAMSCGLAVVGTNVIGISDLIQHGENGLLADLKPESLRNAILQLSNSQVLRKRLGGEARKNVVSNNCLEARISKEKIFLNSFVDG